MKVEIKEIHASTVKDLGEEVNKRLALYSKKGQKVQDVSVQQLINTVNGRILHHSSQYLVTFKFKDNVNYDYSPFA